MMTCRCDGVIVAIAVFFRSGASWLFLLAGGDAKISTHRVFAEINLDAGNGFRDARHFGLKVGQSNPPIIADKGILT